MNSNDDHRYDSLVFDGARDLACAYRHDQDGMREHLISLNATEAEIDAVIDAMNSPEYHEAPYRGKNCDEGVIEAIKDILRYYNGFNTRD